jgi:hypothetical protein
MRQGASQKTSAQHEFLSYCDPRHVYGRMEANDLANECMVRREAAHIRDAKQQQMRNSHQSFLPQFTLLPLSQQWVRLT